MRSDLLWLGFTVSSTTRQKHKQKDISGMLFFDGNFLCVNRLVDAHSLYRKTETKFSPGCQALQTDE